MRVFIRTETISPDQALAAFAQGGETGAVASFIGYARGEQGAVDCLELEHYPGFTEAEIARMAELVRARHDLFDLLVIHRVGVIPAGEAIVLVAATSVHRAPALAAVSELMDYLKTEAPIWKKEIGAVGARWVEPSEADLQAAARWRVNDGAQS